MHRQRESQVTDLDRVGRAVGQVNCPAEHAALRFQANGYFQCGTAIIPHLPGTRRVRGSRSLCRVKLLPWAVGTPPRDLNMTKFLTCCDVVRRKGIRGEAETRQRSSIELEKKRRSCTDRLR